MKTNIKSAELTKTNPMWLRFSFIFIVKQQEASSFVLLFTLHSVLVWIIICAICNNAYGSVYKDTQFKVFRT